MHAIFDSFDSFEILEDSIQCFGIRDLVYTSLSFQLWLKVEDRKFKDGCNISAQRSSINISVQFVYMLLVGTYPFNSFLAGFLCCGGFFVLTGKPFIRAETDLNRDPRLCSEEICKIRRSPGNKVVINTNRPLPHTPLPTVTILWRIQMTP
jgi:hypothetical protein